MDKQTRNFLERIIVTCDAYWNYKSTLFVKLVFEGNLVELHTKACFMKFRSVHSSLHVGETKKTRRKTISVSNPHQSQSSICHVSWY